MAGVLGTRCTLHPIPPGMNTLYGLWIRIILISNVNYRRFLLEKSLEMFYHVIRGRKLGGLHYIVKYRMYKSLHFHLA